MKEKFLLTLLYRRAEGPGHATHISLSAAEDSGSQLCYPRAGVNYLTRLVLPELPLTSSSVSSVSSAAGNYTWEWNLGAVFTASAVTVRVLPPPLALATWLAASAPAS